MSAAVFVLVCGLIVVGGFAQSKWAKVNGALPMRSERSFAAWRGEIVFAEQLVPFGLGSLSNLPSQMQSFNPRTGLLTPMQISISGPVLQTLVSGDQLWIVAVNEVVQFDGSEVVRYRPKHSLALKSTPFLLNGDLATIDAGVDGFTYLHTFKAGEWNRGRRIAFPGNGRNWLRRSNGQLSMKTEASKDDGRQLFRAVQIGDELHVIAQQFMTTTPSWAYRRGLEFDDDESGTATDQTAGNESTPDEDWYELDRSQFNWGTFLCEIRGELVLISAGISRFWKRSLSKPGKFEPLSLRIDNAQRWQWDSNLAMVRMEENVYRFDISHFQSMRVSHLFGDRFELLQFSVPGMADLIIRLECHIASWIVAVVVVASLVLLIGSHFLTSRWKGNRYVCGQDAVMLAPLSRRWAAKCIDLTVLLLPIVATAIWLLWKIDTEQLFILQMSVIRDFGSFRFFTFWELLASTLNRLPANLHLSIFISMVVAVSWAVLYAVRSITAQGRSGKTFGKWLCGIRVVRSTLRPCGIGRSLVRELVLCVDTLNLTIPVPGVASILMTDANQRLGDLVADTIVVDSHRS